MQPFDTAFAGKADMNGVAGPPVPIGTAPKLL